jgi:hypothetical protein
MAKLRVASRLHSGSAEAGYELDHRATGVGTHRVEVSGWDISQSFFVEKPELEWNEVNGKQITLRRVLRKKTMLFARLLQSTAPDRSSPVAYWAEHIATTPQGFHQFRLNQVFPHI